MDHIIMIHGLPINKENKIKRNVIISDIENCGLNMIDIASKISSLRLAWISRFFYDNGSYWKNMFRYWSDKIGGLPLCLHFNCNIKDMNLLCSKHNLPEFYVDLFCTWSN